MSHTQNMENLIKQKKILTNAKTNVDVALETAFAVSAEEKQTKDEEKGKGMFLSPQDAEEYRAYKRRKKVEEIMAAIAKSEASLLNGEDPQRVCERAIRLKQAAIKVPPSWLPKAKTYLGGSKVKIDCVIGGNGETLTKVKAYEMRVALKENAKELTILITPSLLAQGKFAEIKKELKKLCRTAKRSVVKVWINSNYPLSTLSKIARICCEVGVKYLCVPYFAGCEKLRFDLINGCQMEVSEVETLEEYRKLCEAGIGRIVTRNIWEIYSEWMKEADKIHNEGTTRLEQNVSQKSTEEKKETCLEKTNAIQEESKSKLALVAQTNVSLSQQKTQTAAQNAKSAEESVKALSVEKKIENKQEDTQKENHANLQGSDLKFL